MKLKKYKKKNIVIVMLVIMLAVTAIIARASKKSVKFNTAPVAGIGAQVGLKRVNIIFHTGVVDPVKLQQIKDLFIQQDAEYRAKGKDLYINGVKPRDLDLTKIGDSNSTVPMQVPIETK